MARNKSTTNIFDLKLKGIWEYKIKCNPLGIQYLFPTKDGLMVSVMGLYSKFGGDGLWQFAIMKDGDIYMDNSESHLTNVQIEKRLKKVGAIEE